MAGRRQTDKTTVARQVLDAITRPSHYGSADAPSLQSGIWIEQQWEVARLLAQEAKGREGAVLVLDEIQKVPGWSEIVKRCWDADTTARLSSAAHALDRRGRPAVGAVLPDADRRTPRRLSR